MVASNNACLVQSNNKDFWSSRRQCQPTQFMPTRHSGHTLNRCKETENVEEAGHIYHRDQIGPEKDSDNSGDCPAAEVSSESY